MQNLWKPHKLDYDIQKLELEHIDFLKENYREGTNLEFKQSYTSNVAKTACAFLNTEGGWIILGVGEENEKITSYYGIDENFLDTFRRSFTLLDPYYDWDPDIYSKAIPLKGGNFIYVLKIPKSKNSHMRNGVYYYRFGSETTTLTRQSDINELKQEKGELDALGREIQRYKKIPSKFYYKFIGRYKVHQILLNELNGHHPIISIDGIGGVGKSTLALEIAHECYEQRLFDSVLWFSAKKEKLTYSQITAIDPDFTNLPTLLERIGLELRIPNYEKFTEENKIDTVIDLLKDNSILMILDNLETIIIKQNLIEFLARVEGNSKILITSRERIGQLERVIVLNPFTFENSKQFIESESELRSFLLIKDRDQIFEELYRLTRGIPLAIKILLGWIVDGISLSELEDKLNDPNAEILRFCFEETYENRLSSECKELLCAFSVLPDEITYQEIEACVDLDSETLDKCIKILLNYSLITIETKNMEEIGDEEIYKMLPLTRIFGYKKIEDFINLERRTVKKYNNYLNETKQFLTDLEILKKKEDLVGLNQIQQKAYLKARRAVSLFEEGDYTSSLSLFREAEALADDLPEIYFMWANVESNIGHFRITEELYERTIILNPKNPTYWLTWAGFHRRIKNEERAKEILLNSLKEIPSHEQHVLRRELGIILCNLEEYNPSLEILKQNLIRSPIKENDFILNTKTLSSILSTYIFQARHYERERQWAIAENKYLEALDFYQKNLDIVTKTASGLNWRLKQIYRGLARRTGHYDFDMGVFYFSKSYYNKPKNSREKDENKYFIKDWLYFVNTWKNRGKSIDDFPEDYENKLKKIYGLSYGEKDVVKITSKEKRFMKFKIAVELLERTLKTVLTERKEPRFEVIDGYMRKDDKIFYIGAKYIEKPDKTGSFSSFSEFINEVKNMGKIKIISNGQYKEIHLKKFTIP